MHTKRIEMKLTTEGMEPTDAVEAYARLVLPAALGVYQSEVTTVRLRLVDVNGPDKGGIDKRCWIALQLVQGPDVVAESLHSDGEQAIRLAATEVARLLTRRFAVLTAKTEVARSAEGEDAPLPPPVSNQPVETATRKAGQIRLAAQATAPRSIHLGVLNDRANDIRTRLNVLPSALVAWADGHLDPKEKEVLERIATESLTSTKSEKPVAYRNWLQRMPTKEEVESWIRLVNEFLPRLTVPFRESFLAQLRKNLWLVARASRASHQACATERAVIARIDLILRSAA